MTASRLCARSYTGEGRDLRSASRCTERKEVVVRLKALGDERALPTLRWFDRQPRRGCGFIKLEDCYGCMRTELKEAIEALE